MIAGEKRVEPQRFRKSAGSQHTLSRRRIVAPGIDLQGESDFVAARRHP
jgi:hypothetical protein